MRKILIVFLVLTAFMALPLLAQEEEAMMAPPGPLADDLCKWMVGEWEGWTESPMGKFEEQQKVEWGLDNQFVVIHVTSKMGDLTPEQMKAMADMMKMSVENLEKMKDMPYKGIGPMTIDPKTGDFIGYWFDNWRGIYKGTGKREGNKITMTWEGPMGKSVRTIEKVSEDEMVENFKEEGPEGSMIEGKTRLTRKKM